MCTTFGSLGLFSMEKTISLQSSGNDNSCLIELCVPTSQVRRVQSLVETLDKLKARNANPFSDHNKAVSVTTQWETFENGMGSLSAPPPRVSSTQDNTDWEQFD